MKHTFGIHVTTEGEHRSVVGVSAVYVTNVSKTFFDKRLPFDSMDERSRWLLKEAREVKDRAALLQGFRRFWWDYGRGADVVAWDVYDGTARLFAELRTLYAPSEPAPIHEIATLLQVNDAMHGTRIGNIVNYVEQTGIRVPLRRHAVSPLWFACAAAFVWRDFFSRMEDGRAKAVAKAS